MGGFAGGEPYRRLTLSPAAKRHWAGQSVARTSFPEQGWPDRGRVQPGWLAAGARWIGLTPAVGGGIAGHGTPRPATILACTHKRATDPSSGCAGPALTRRARVATVALRRCSRWPPGPVLPMRQKVTGGVVRSSAGGRRLRRGHEAVALDGPDEPGEVPLDAQPRNQGCAATARRAPRSASLRRLVEEFAPQRLAAIRPLLGVWHSRTCGECHTPKSQKLRARPC